MRRVSYLNRSFTSNNEMESLNIYCRIDICKTIVTCYDNVEFHISSRRHYSRNDRSSRVSSSWLINWIWEIAFLYWINIYSNSPHCANTRYISSWEIPGSRKKPKKKERKLFELICLTSPIFWHSFIWVISLILNL